MEKKKSIIVMGKIVYPDRIGPAENILIVNGRIAAILPPDATIPGGITPIDARGMFITPGFIDIHTHGCAGADVMDASPDALTAFAKAKAKEGVTGFLPTVTAATRGAISLAVSTLKDYDPAGGAEILGLHLEGPSLNTEKAGALPTSGIRPIDPFEYSSYFASGLVKLITIAPEQTGALELISQGRSQGIVFSIGHTRATYEQAKLAVDAGATSATHLFNAMDPLHHRDPGAIGAVLDDPRFYAEIIADGVHLHPAIIRLVVKVKGPERLVLVTDSIRASGMPDGETTLAGEKVTVKDGIARTQAGALAGSTLTLDQALRNFITFTGLPLPEAVRTVTSTPATLLGLTEKKGAIAVSKDADLVMLDPSLNVTGTILHGEIIYQKE